MSKQEAQDNLNRYLKSIMKGMRAPCGLGGSFIPTVNRMLKDIDEATG